jgi:uncharacterized membrane protein
MKILRLAFQRERAIPVLALLFASIFGVALVLLRISLTGNIKYGFLIWNLFLAWLPLLFALLACEEFKTGASRSWRFLGFAGTWLLFFPNAPYIFTDLIHLTTHFYRHFWVDLVLILLFSMIGLVLGFVSLFLMQAVVRRLFGPVASWFFIAGVAALSGIGIYLGRFLRFNSWDLLLKPLALWQGIGTLVVNPMTRSTPLAFPVLFAAFLFTAYLMLYALTHLQHPQLITSNVPTPHRDTETPA